MNAIIRKSVAARVPYLHLGWIVAISMHLFTCVMFLRGCVQIESDVTVPFIGREYSVVGQIIPQLWQLLFFLHFPAIVPVLVLGVRRLIPAWCSLICYAITIVAFGVTIGMTSSISEPLRKYAYVPVANVPMAEPQVYDQIVENLLREGFTVVSPRIGDTNRLIQISPRYMSDPSRVRELLERAGLSKYWCSDCEGAQGRATMNGK